MPLHRLCLVANKAITPQLGDFICAHVRHIRGEWRQRPYVILPSAHSLADIRQYMASLRRNKRYTSSLGLRFLTQQGLFEDCLRRQGQMTESLLEEVWPVFDALAQQTELRGLFGEDPGAWMAAAQELMSMAKELDAFNKLDPNAWFDALPEAQVNSPWLSQEARFLLSVAQALFGHGASSQRMLAHAWASQVDADVIWVSDGESPPWLEGVLQEIALHHHVWHIEAAHPLAWSNHRWSEVWTEMVPTDLMSTDLTATEEIILEPWPESCPRWYAYPADNFEHAALATAQHIYQQLQQHPQETVALVAFDRMLARRVRALLERADILVDDKTGWALSTTASATALMRYFDFLSRDDISIFVDWLNSPFIALNQLLPAGHEITTLLADLQTQIHQKNWVRGLKKVARFIMQRDTPALTQAIQGLVALQAKKTVSASELQSGWSAFSLDALLGKDPAGQLVLAAWATVCRLFEGQSHPLRTWRAALAFELEQGRFRANDISSPVMLLALSSTRLREFDHVVLLGCDAKKLPSYGGDTLFFTDTVRQELGLKTRQEQHHQAMRDLARAITMSRSVCAIWQAWDEEEPIPMSPWLKRLPELSQATLLTLPELSLTGQHLIPEGMRPDGHARATIKDLGRMPDSISPSAAQVLLVCPYLYYVQYILGLKAVTLNSESPEKRVAGTVMHGALSHFHKKHPVLNPSKLEHYIAELSLAIRKHFAQDISENPAFLGRLEELLSCVPDYIHWVVTQLGACYFTEHPLEVELVSEPKRMTIRGQIDRVDRLDDGSYSIIDYKLASAAAVKKMANDPTQVALYSKMYALQHADEDAEVSQVAYVGVDRTQTSMYPINNLTELADKKFYSLQSAMHQMMQGSDLVAKAPFSVCKDCFARGVCRRGYTHE